MRGLLREFDERYSSDSYHSEGDDEDERASVGLSRLWRLRPFEAARDPRLGFAKKRRPLERLGVLVR